MNKIRAKLKTAEEITGEEGCTCFSGTDFTYTPEMNNLAIKNKFIEFTYKKNTIYLNELFSYDYFYNNHNDKISFIFYVKKEWLKDIQDIQETKDVKTISDLIKDLIKVDSKENKFYNSNIYFPTSIDDKAKMIFIFTEEILLEDKVKKFPTDPSKWFGPGRIFECTFDINLESPDIKIINKGDKNES